LIIKKNAGSGALKNWHLVDWANPFTPEEEEEVFSCEFTSYVSDTTKRQADMCVHTFNDVVSNQVRSNSGWVILRLVVK
jgi:hypothetical protein